METSEKLYLIVILNPDVFCRGEESIVLLDGFFTSLRSVQNDNTHVHAIMSLAGA